METKKETHDVPTRCQNIGAVICLTIMLIDWISFAITMQYLTETGFKNLFFIQYINVSAYMIIIIPWYFIYKHQSTKLQIQQTNNKSLNKSDHQQLASISDFFQEIFVGGALIGTCQFFQGYFWYLSLDHTVVAANNTIYQSQCVFVLLFSSCFLGTEIPYYKMAAVLFAFAGVICVSFGTTKEDRHDIKTTWYGIAFCLASTIIYAIESVLNKYLGNKYFRKHLEVIDNFFLQIIMGFFVFIAIWPGIIVLHFTNIEIFALPGNNKNDILTVVLPALFQTVFVASWMTGITLTNPVIMSLGILMIIPCSYIVDVIIWELEITFVGVLGSLMIILSFVIIEIPKERVKKLYCIDKAEKNVSQKYELMSEL
eukprot:65253_1